MVDRILPRITDYDLLDMLARRVRARRKAGDQ
jgi:hypothetical protein